MKIYALLIGIDTYPIFPLSQCVKDVEKIESYLNGLSKQFDAIKILPLTNEEATKEGIAKGISTFLTQAKDEDVALMYYSGHGAQEDTEGRFPSEQDGKLECLVAHFDKKATSGYLLANKEIRYLFSKLPHNPHLISIFDCCHSGNIVRSQENGGKDFMLKRIAGSFPKREAHEFIFSKKIPLETFKTKTVEELIKVKNSVHISACTASQLSWETNKGGVFTRYLLELLKATKNRLTYQEIVRWAKVSLRKVTEIQQTPTISVQGAGKLHAFSSWLNLSAEKNSIIDDKLVIHTENGGWQLLKGKVMGVEKGMEVIVSLAGGKTVTAKVDKVNFDTSSLVFPKESDKNKLKISDRYGANLNATTSPLTIFINDLDISKKNQLIIEKIVQSVGNVKVEGMSAANYWVNISKKWAYLTLPNDEYRPLAKQINLVRQENETEIVFQQRVEEELLHQLEYLARWHHLDTLENSGFRELPINIEILPEGASDWVNVTGLDHYLNAEDTRMNGHLYKKYQIRVKNKTNRRLYLAALTMYNDMQISTAPFGDRVIELGRGEEKYFYDHRSVKDAIVVIDKYKEFYNWKEEFFHIKLIFNNFEDFSDVLADFTQPALPNPMMDIKRGEEPVTPRGGRRPRETKSKNWGTLKTTIWLKNPSYQVANELDSVAVK